MIASNKNLYMHTNSRKVVFPHIVQYAFPFHNDDTPRLTNPQNDTHFLKLVYDRRQRLLVFWGF